MKQSPSSEADRFSASQEIPPHFMEPEGSLPQSQVPAICIYPEPARFIPYPHIPLPVDLSYPPFYAWVSQVVSFSQDSPQKPYIRLSSPLTITCYISPISFFSILAREHN